LPPIFLIIFYYCIMRNVNQILKTGAFIFVTLFYSNVYGQKQVLKYDLTYKPNSLKDNAITEKMVLDIENEKISVFRTERDRESDSLIAATGLGLGRGTTLENQFYIIKHFPENEMYKSILTIYRDIYSIKIDEKLDWQILPEKDKMATFNVQKAKVNYGGRNWTAWFSTDIPIPEGPYVFKGLPGIIIKISDEQNYFIFNLTEIKNSNGEIFHRNKGKVFTWEQFNTVALNYYSDPFARMKSSGLPIKVYDGAGGAVTPDMKVQTDKTKKQIKENNNPIELNHRIDYQ